MAFSFVFRCVGSMPQNGCIVQYAGDDTVLYFRCVIFVPQNGHIVQYAGDDTVFFFKCVSNHVSENILIVQIHLEEIQI